MTEQAPALIRHDLEAKIVKRCWEDESFQKEFTADPAGAFVKYLNVPAASLPKIVVHEEELEKVAGGVTPTIVVLTAAAITGSLAGSGVTASAVVSVDKGW